LLPTRRSVGENHRLHAGDLKPFAAAHILASHLVVFAQHIGARFGKAGTVALVGASAKLALLGAHDPGDFILAGLLAMRTVQGCRFPFSAFVEKISFFHGQLLVAGHYLAAEGSLSLTSIPPSNRE
jgi:hypothetical protein